MTSLYHTALPGGQETDAEPREWWAEGGSQAFVHDVFDGLPPEFMEADVLYGDLPWADGYEEFNRRAGTLLAPPFNEWLYRLNVHLANSGKPWVIFGGVSAARFLGCEWIRRGRLNGSVSALMGARLPPPPEGMTDAEDVLLWLSGNPAFNVVGDFCMGYGRTARIFAKAGKQFIGCDFNPSCIGHVAREAHKWQPAEED